MATDIVFVHPGRQRNGKKKRERKSKPWHVEMTDVELRRRYPFSRANILFILRLIKETTCQSTQRSNPISAELRVNSQNSVFHQTFIVKCHLSSVKTKVVKLSDHRVTSWNYPATLQSAGGTPVVLLLCYFLHISIKIFMKTAIPIWTIFWKMPRFTLGEIFCQE